MAGTKKRKRASKTNSSSLWNLTRVGGNPKEESIDELLAELEDKPIEADEKVKAAAIVDCDGGNNTSDLLPWNFSRRDVFVPKNKVNVSTWNNSLSQWIKTGKYSEGLLPNFELEMSRHFQMEKLSSIVLKSHYDVRMPTFERWIIDSKLEEENSRDPVIPNAITTSGASQRFKKELSQSLDSSKAETILQSLCLQTSGALQDLTVLQLRTKNKCPLKKGDRLHVEDRDDGMKALLYGRKSWKKPYCIKLNVLHYQKVRTMFEHVHGSIPPKGMHAFHLILMCLLLRYSSLSGGQLLNDLRGGGMQGAIHPLVFHELHQYFGRPFIELFASPLNAYYLTFGSAFSTLDWHFGSIGDFFDQRLEEGCYEVNPPFSPGLMMKMAIQLCKHVEMANRNDKSLTFIVIIPSARSGGPLARQSAVESFKKLREIASKEIVLEARNHIYVEGAQHLKPTRYKKSSYDTSVFILQSQKADSTSDLSKLEQIITAAFCERNTPGLEN
mmetsp:Transcript_22951/g.33873  ORF Transcript_22951/g.33873 Transcript_22951/m.33873 type:complete len:499 (+) Transcript_22951:114-1610(+)|eukprot:CAMPEP_0194213344 /NCGR_PEP_ID=MMETSP0156-20130528/13824_1 /TAXON_ID=33649 /ORGANISM="Thalassionema nitzschioides, Strain L26-B" /LENGTH=498 /DNA_ID=CAMNT_0038941341 /DNA_START=51 /DNA_END=1547 /DNA_ORIENTATION=-